MAPTHAAWRMRNTARQVERCQYHLPTCQSHINIAGGTSMSHGPTEAIARARTIAACAIRRRNQGQSLVEFALVLPVILLVLLVAIDFGRVYLGYINVQNMARIGANYAAAH